MTKKRLGSRERLRALQLFLETWWWQYIIMVKLGWRRLWSCLIEHFDALPTTCQEVDVICQMTLLKFLGDVMSVKPRRQGVASNPTHVNLLPCQEKGLDSKSAASLFLDRCFQMFELLKEFICDNASIINSEFLSDLFAMSGVEQHSLVAYRTQSNGRAERAVQGIINSLRQYLEQPWGLQQAPFGGGLAIRPLGFERFAGGSQWVFPTSTYFWWSSCRLGGLFARIPTAWS